MIGIGFGGYLVPYNYVGTIKASIGVTGLCSDAIQMFRLQLLFIGLRV